MSDYEKIPIPQPQAGREVRWESLSGEIVIEDFTDGKKIFRIGNTGAEAVVSKRSEGDEEWSIHFVPEQIAYKDENNRIKYALLSAFALYKFIEWYRNVRDWEVYGVSRPHVLVGKTNPVMYQFMNHLIGKHISGTIKGEYFQCRINLDSLASDGGVMERVQALSQRAQKNDLRIKQDDSTF